MQQSLKSTIASVLLGTFILSSFLALPVEAKPKHDNGKKIHSEYKHHKKEHCDCNDIILTVLALDNFNYGRAHRAGMSLEDLIITQYIANKITAMTLKIYSGCRKTVSPIRKSAKPMVLIGAVFAVG